MTSAAAGREAAFRRCLYLGTRNEHDATEAVFAPFTDDPLSRLTWFLAAQRSGLAAIFDSRASDACVLSGAVVSDLVRRLDLDLLATGTTVAEVTPTGPLDALAVDYLILGSRLGTQALRLRLFSGHASDTIPAYFRAPALPQLWSAHCVALDAIPPDSARADRIIEDVKTGFALFGHAAAAQKT
ncbi:hypothetical protein [uncultured Roseibium sp.]|uniref:hypothetical protein n=1 Tax=uncultured Roseibium sp. TaxID=1936171 RepID=UPI00261C2041|nr:hypothetical protein [uncultured Roseibium sp.]